MSINSFLPEDYLARKAERRTNIICLALFAVVMTGVFMAFLVTNRQWAQVKAEQAVINQRYQNAGQQIQQHSELEKQRDEMLNKAELAAALVERVPRSILLAELINRMPQQFGLLELELKSERQAPRAAAAANQQRQQGGTTRLAGPRAPTREEAGDSARRIEPPRYTVSIVMTGVAPTDLELSRYIAELRSYPLLADPSLDYVEQREIEGRMVRQFRLSAHLVEQADVRQIEPLEVPRGGLRNPMRTGVSEPGRGGPVAFGDR